jgi:hypothetical protein
MTIDRGIEEQLPREAETNNLRLLNSLTLFLFFFYPSIIHTHTHTPKSPIQIYRLHSLLILLLAPHISPPFIKAPSFTLYP